METWYIIIILYLTVLFTIPPLQYILLACAIASSIWLIGSTKKTNKSVNLQTVEMSPKISTETFIPVKTTRPEIPSKLFGRYSPQTTQINDNLN